MARSGYKVGVYLKGNTFTVLPPGTTVKMDLRNRQNDIVGSALVDLKDWDRVQKYTWSLNRRTGYVFTSIWDGVGKRRYPRLHQIVLGTGFEDIVDHLFHDKTDNRRGKLRVCTKSQNGHNHIKLHVNNKSGFRGVCYQGNEKRKKRWQVYLDFEGRTVERKRCFTFTEAVEQRKEWENQYNPSGLNNAQI